MGYYEADPNEKDYNEAYGYMRNAEKKALKDAKRLAKLLAFDLGIKIPTDTRKILLPVQILPLLEVKLQSIYL